MAAEAVAVSTVAAGAAASTAVGVAVIVAEVGILAAGPTAAGGADITAVAAGPIVAEVVQTAAADPRDAPTLAAVPVRATTAGTVDTRAGCPTCPHSIAARSRAIAVRLQGLPQARISALALRRAMARQPMANGILLPALEAPQAQPVRTRTAPRAPLLIPAHAISHGPMEVQPGAEVLAQGPPRHPRA
jgi:hypothetical protein